MLAAFVLLACQQSAEQVEARTPNTESALRESVPAPAEPAPAEPAPVEPAPAQLPSSQPEPTPSAEACHELERLAALACAHVKPEECGSGSCSCKITQKEPEYLNPCEPRGFARLRVDDETLAVYFRDGAIWVGSDSMPDFDSAYSVNDPADSDAKLFEYEEYQSYDDDYGTYELWVTAKMLCAVIAEKPRCSKPIIQNYVLSDSTEEARKRPISLGYTAELEFTETGLTVEVERGDDRQRAQKKAPHARFLRAGEYSFDEVLDRPLERR